MTKATRKPANAANRVEKVTKKISTTGHDTVKKHNKSTIDAAVGRRLVEARKRAVMYGMDLAGICGLNRGTISAIERGYKSARPSTLSKLAAALSVSATWLATGEGEADYKPATEASAAVVPPRPVGAREARAAAHWRPDPGSPLGKRAGAIQALEERLQPVLDAFVASYLSEDRRAAFLSQLEFWGELEFSFDAWTMVKLMRKWLGEVDELLGDRDDFNADWHAARISAPDWVEPEWPEEYR